jgi:hypothetical protein
MRKLLNLFKRKKESKEPTWDLTKRNPDKCKSNVKHSFGQKRQILYSPHAKRVVSKSPEIIKSFLEMFNSLKRVQTLTRQVTLKSGEKIVYSLSKIPRPTKNSKVTSNFFIFEVLRAGKTSRYFVKHLDLQTNIFFRSYHGVNEMLALKMIKKAGFNVVPSYLSYSDKGKSFIFYRYQEKLIDAEKAYIKGILTEKDISNIRAKLYRAEKEVNKYSKGKNIKSKYYEGKEIADIYPIPSKEFESLPVFIDPKTKKLFIYDPIFYEKEY